MNRIKLNTGFGSPTGFHIDMVMPPAMLPPSPLLSLPRAINVQPEGKMTLSSSIEGSETHRCI